MRLLLGGFLEESSLSVSGYGHPEMNLLICCYATRLQTLMAFTPNQSNFHPIAARIPNLRSLAYMQFHCNFSNQKFFLDFLLPCSVMIDTERDVSPYLITMILTHCAVNSSSFSSPLRADFFR
jgi:hypothetical protein